MEQNIQDPREQGTSGLDGLKGVNKINSSKKTKTRELLDNINNLTKDPEYTGYKLIDLNIQYRIDTDINNPNRLDSGPIDMSLYPEWGKSKYDKNLINELDYSNINDIRAKAQSDLAKIGAGIAKGSILAGTTFISGTLGAIWGIGTAIATGKLSGLWDNSISNAMYELNQWSESAIPNYYTDEERANQESGQWYKNIFTANFLGDVLVKNTGFMVGAMYSGMVGSGAISAINKGINAVGKGISGISKFGSIGKTGLNTAKAKRGIDAIYDKVAKSTPKIGRKLAGSATSAMNEANIEAKNNAEDFMNFENLKENDRYNATLEAIKQQYGGTEMYNTLVSNENQRHADMLAKIQEDGAKMGNAVMLQNFPILMAQDMFMFGKMYAGGAKTAKRVSKRIGTEILDDGTKVYKAGRKGVAVAKGAAKGLANAASEGTEEFMQLVAAENAASYYENDLTNFYNLQLNPNAEQKTISWINNFGNTFSKVVSDPNSYQDFSVGFLMGALGLPSFRMTKNSQGKLQSPITFNGGAFEKYNEVMSNYRRDKEIVNRLNERIQSEDFLNYYHGLIRHNNLEDVMNVAASQDDDFGYKNAESAQLISDISMFANAGKLDDLLATIEGLDDLSDENLDAIIDYTTTQSEDGTFVGPYIDSSGNKMTATPEGKEEMKNLILKRKTEINDAINNYIKERKDIDSKTNEVLSDDNLTELTWLKIYSDDAKYRIKTLKNEINDSLQIDTLIQNAQTTINDLEENIDYKSEKDNIRNKINDLKREILLYEKTKEIVNNLDDSEFVMKDLETFASAIEQISAQNSDSNIAFDDISKKFVDAVKLNNLQRYTYAKFIEYLTNPSQINRDKERTYNQAKQATETATKEVYKEQLNSKTTIQEIRNLYNKNSANEDFINAFNELLETNELVKQFNDINKYYIFLQNKIQENINGMLNDSKNKSEIENVLNQILTNHINSANNLEEAQNFKNIKSPITNNFDNLSIEENDEIRNKAFNILSTIMNNYNEEYNNNANMSKSSVSDEDVKNKYANKKTLTIKEIVDVITTEGFNNYVNSLNDKKPSEYLNMYKYMKNNAMIKLLEPHVYDYLGITKETDSEKAVKKELDTLTKTINAYNYLKKLFVKLHNNEELNKIENQTYERILTTYPILNYMYDIIVELTKLDPTSQEYIDNDKNIINEITNFVKNQNTTTSTETTSTETTSTKTKSTETTNTETKSTETTNTENNQENNIVIDTNQNDKSSNEIIQNNNDEISTNIENNNNKSIIPTNNDEDKIQYYRPAIPEMVKEITRNSDGSIKETKVIPFNEAKKKEGKDFDKIYNYLSSNGAFDYINKGHLKIGDKLYFKIDSSFDNETVFLITKEGQVVGSLNLKPYADKFEGLSELLTRVQDEYKKAKDKKSFIYDKESITVEKLISGTPMYTNTSNNLHSLNLPSDVRLGIVTNSGVIINDDENIDRYFIPEITRKDKLGNVFLFIKDINGNYYPVSVRINHISLSQTKENNSPIYTLLHNELKQIANLNDDSTNELSKHILKIKSFLDLRNYYLDYIIGKNEEIIGLRITEFYRDNNNKVIFENGKRKENSKAVFFATNNKEILIFGDENGNEVDQSKSIDQIANEIFDVFVEFGINLNIDLGSINKYDYNQVLINSDLFSSNISSDILVNNWFQTSYIDKNGNEHSNFETKKADLSRKIITNDKENVSYDTNSEFSTPQSSNEIVKDEQKSTNDEVITDSPASESSESNSKTQNIFEVKSKITEIVNNEDELNEFEDDEVNENNEDELEQIETKSILSKEMLVDILKKVDFNTSNIEDNKLFFIVMNTLTPILREKNITLDEFNEVPEILKERIILNNYIKDIIDVKEYSLNKKEFLKKNNLSNKKYNDLTDEQKLQILKCKK
ncbi:MAG: hypothetical protein LBM96_05830 [Methanobrevibacter sp.]|jgi:hypothetical protein|nr:hypothetical protein [Candidatus Methanoflexus mossambicus]